MKDWDRFEERKIVNKRWNNYTPWDDHVDIAELDPLVSLILPIDVAAKSEVVLNSFIYIFHQINTSNNYY